MSAEVNENVVNLLSELILSVEEQEYISSSLSPVFGFGMNISNREGEGTCDSQQNVPFFHYDRPFKSYNSNLYPSNPCNTEYFSNGISTPPNDTMGCGTPLQHLLKTFSPTTAKCIEKEFDFNQPINYKFLKNISPHFMMNFVSKLQESEIENIIDDDAKEIYSKHREEDSAGKTNNGEYYPGSMLRGNPENFTTSPSVLENYLNQNAEDEEEEENAAEREEKNSHQYNENFPTTKYIEETISSSYQSIWQNMTTNYGFNLPPGNMLAPVMLSSYQEMATLQHELQTLNGGNDNFVLPVFFQYPYPMPHQYVGPHEKYYEEQNKQAQEQKEEYLTKEESENRDQKTFTTLTNIGAKSTDAWSHYDDDELLRKCQLACMEAEGYVERGKQSTTTNLVNASLHNDSMKYLEEAALKLLQSSTRKQPESRRRYQKRGGVKGHYQCKICAKVFKRVFTLKTHERVHTGLKPYKCEFCNQFFRQSGTKRNHIRAVHAKEKPYECDYCSKLFAHKSSLVVHRRIHTKEKPYKCETCGRKFTDRATYKKHDAIHSREKRFKCSICRKCFTQQSNLKRHIRTIHLELSQNEYQKFMEITPKIESS